MLVVLLQQSCWCLPRHCPLFSRTKPGNRKALTGQSQVLSLFLSPVIVHLFVPSHLWGGEVLVPSLVCRDLHSHTPPAKRSGGWGSLQTQPEELGGQQMAQWQDYFREVRTAWSLLCLITAKRINLSSMAAMSLWLGLGRRAVKCSASINGCFKLAPPIGKHSSTMSHSVLHFFVI